MKSNTRIYLSTFALLIIAIFQAKADDLYSGRLNAEERLDVLENRVDALEQPGEAMFNTRRAVISKLNASLFTKKNLFDAYYGVHVICYTK